MSKKTKTEILIDGWINEMEAAGLTYDEMIIVFRLAKAKLEHLRSKDNAQT